MRCWFVLMIYPMETENEGRNLRSSVHHKRPLHSSLGNIVIQKYNKEKDIFIALNCITDEIINIEKKNIDFTRFCN